jgi:predicted AAA+ superfamily ATPase
LYDNAQALINMVIKRDLTAEIIDALSKYSILIITGPRQSGKTTLSKLVLNKTYINLESPDTRELVEKDPRFFLSNIMEQGAIIDEFQRVPELASYLQELVDNRKQNGLFILTGSNNFLMMENVSQSLAGRAAIFKLLPFSISEIAQYNKGYTTDELLYNGFYPSIYSENRNPTKTYDYYFQTYIERDVRQLINLKDLHIFQKFMRLCAGRIGQLLNYEQLANETGVSSKTIKSWISVLEASYIIFLLPPYFENINKRVVKSHKLYFTDVGLASYLLGIEEKSHITYHPLRGALFENMVVCEYLKTRYNNGLNLNAYFYRDNHQNEVDLVIKSGNNYTLVEIKSSQTFHNRFFEKIDWLENTLKVEQVRKIVVYDGEQEWKNESKLIVNFRNFIREI